MSHLIPNRLQTSDVNGTGDRTNDSQKIRAHHSFVLRVDRVRICLIDETPVSVRSYGDGCGMSSALGGLIFKVDEKRRNKDEEQNRRDHYVVMKTATLVRPEDITLDGAPDAMHANSVFGEGRFAKAPTRSGLQLDQTNGFGAARINRMGPNVIENLLQLRILGRERRGQVAGIGLGSVEIRA